MGIMRAASFRCSVLDALTDWGPCSRFAPFIVALEFQPELVVIDQQISVTAACDRVWHDLLHFLRHDAD